MQNFTYASLDPVPVTPATEKHARVHRTHQGIPGIERIPSGRLFAVWYAGGVTECCENYAMLSISDDNGKNWRSPVAVVDPPHPSVRAFDSTLWAAPDGRFFWFWAQGCGGPAGTSDIYDGIAGVWYSILENPEDDPEQFRFSPSVRISNGIMMNKPTVLSDGIWCLPVSLWSSPSFRRHDSLGVKPGCYLVVSEDRGKSFSIRGRVDMRRVEGGAVFDEHMFVELGDGTLQVLIRVNSGIAEAFSYDRGFTWTAPALSRSISGPNSRLFIRRLKSGRLLLVNNDVSQVTATTSWRPRERMTAYLSEDDGKTWPYRLLLDERAPVSYPDGTEGSDGFLYLIHDYLRAGGGYIYLSRITEEDILAGTLKNPGSALKLEIDRSNPVPEKKG